MRELASRLAAVPTISVVIPAYNQPGMLSEALAGVERQTVAPSEVIIIDDCSPEPLEGPTSFSPELPVRFIRNAVNLGPAGAVARGIRESRGELVAILNHDDIWEPEFLERLSRELEADPHAGFAFCDHGVMRGGGEHDERLSIEHSARFGRAGLKAGALSGRALQEAVLGKSVAASSFSLVRRSALDLPLIEAGSDMWDYALGVGACRASGRAVFVSQRLGWYRVSETMLSTTWSDPRKQVELARPAITILMVVLISRQYAEIRRPALGRLLVAIRHALAASVRTGSPSSVARVTTRILTGARDARRLTPSRPAPVL
jgi:glycosyltransferase involved in cell wall biosynthesis